jgi:anthranilate phosphoribosyltransferase
MTLTEIVKLLVLHPAQFTPQHAKDAIAHLLSPDTNPLLSAAFLTAFTNQQRDTDPVLVHACAQALRSHAQHLTFQHHHAWLQRALVDIVGTGGDGHDTFNVSTTAAIVAAGCGVKMAKHGNRASTSRSGSADLLEHLGCALDTLYGSDDTATFLADNNFVFLFAQSYHPHLKHLAVTRRALPFPTVFNLLGPLLNPACPTRVVIGVRHPSLGRLMVEALKLDGVHRALVVCGKEGLDEISPAGETDVWELTAEGHVLEYEICPEDFGLSRHPLDSVKGLGPAENAEFLEQMLNGGVDMNHPIVEFVLMNTAAVLKVAGTVERWRDGVTLAKESMTSGKAWQELQQFKRFTVQYTT